MRYNDFGIDFKYLLVNKRDKAFGLTVNTVGFQPIQPDSLYPSTDHPQSYFFCPDKGRILSEYQILYISKGMGTFQSESTKKTTITKGQIIVSFPGMWHTYCPQKETGWNEYYIGFEGPIIDNLVENSFITPQNQVLDVGFNEDLVNLFTTAIKIAKDEKKSTQQYLAGIVLHIFGLILSSSQNRELETNGSTQIIERAKIIMNENIHRNIDVQEIASKLGTGYSWFRKYFKDYTGYSPAQYFLELKLRRAKVLLTESTYSIKEISFELNFSSYEYFLSFFKKRVGMTPLEYRSLGKI